MSDLFNLKQQAEKQRQALETYAKTGAGLQEHDPDWHLPWLLNEEASQLMHHLKQFFDGQPFTPRKPSDRNSLERQRFNLFEAMFEHLLEKYSVAHDTKMLFSKIESGETGFVLFLRGFAYRSHYLKEVTVNEATDISELIQRNEIAQKLNPAPLLWVSNPVDSGPLDQVAATYISKVTTQGFRMDLGSDWEKVIQTLIQTASFIIVHNSQMTPGVVREIEFIKQFGRLEQTFFQCPEKASKIVGSKEPRHLTNEAVEYMRKTISGKKTPSGIFPAPTILWVGGKRRINLESDALEITASLNRKIQDKQDVPLDFFFDSISYLVASTIIIERIDLLASLLVWLSQMFCALKDEQIADREFLAKNYMNYASPLQIALNETPLKPDLTDTLIEVFQRYLRVA